MTRAQHRLHRHDPAYVTVAGIVARVLADRRATARVRLAAADTAVLHPVPPPPAGGGARCATTPTPR